MYIMYNFKHTYELWNKMMEINHLPQIMVIYEKLDSGGITSNFYYLSLYYINFLIQIKAMLITHEYVNF